MSDFDLTRNPFAVLRTGPRVSRDQLSDAYHDAILEAAHPTDEAALDRAQQALSTPRDRIDAELGYFVFAKPATAKEVTARLQRGEVATAGDLVSIDRANLVAHMCRTAAPDEVGRLVDLLVGSYRDIAADEVLEAVNATRSVSGFGTVDKQTFQTGFRRLTEQHAEVAISTIMKSRDPGLELSARILSLKEAEGAQRQLLEAMLRHYEREAGPLLDAKAAAVEGTLAAIRKAPQDRGALAAFERELQAWDSIAQPLQLADQLRGLDEHRSATLFKAIRHVALELANKCNEHDAALKLTRVTAVALAELPGVVGQLREDETALLELIETDRFAASMAPLYEALEVADQSHSLLARAVARCGFGVGATSPAVEIRDGYRSVLEAGDELSIETATLAIRSLAIDCCNESKDNETALAIIDWLLSHHEQLKASVIEKLKDDAHTVRRNRHFNELTSALERKDLSYARTLVSKLLPDCDAEERQQLTLLQGRLQSQRRSQLFKWTVWAGIGGFAVFSVLGERTSTPSSSYQPTSYDADQAAPVVVPTDAGSPPDLGTTTVTASAPSDTYSQPQAPTQIQEPETSDDQSETPPPPYTSDALSRPQLRYCTRQKTRIEAAQSMSLTNPQIDRFNAAVSDYNSRCSSFRYRERDMAVVHAEIDSSRPQLEREGRQLVGDEYQ